MICVCIRIRTSVITVGAFPKFVPCTARSMSIIVHGGAWNVPKPLREEKKKGCEIAAGVGYECLQKGGTAIDAVERAVRSLEDNPSANAGHGSVLNENGEIEMDALIVDGKTLNFGSVASVKDIPNPISLARMVMERTEHVFLVGKGANQFAKEMGVAVVPPEELLTEGGRQQWEEFKQYRSVVKTQFSGPSESSDTDHDTVGAVAIDNHGNLAAATSTGGITFKKAGRVGDSPIVGCGAACDNTLGGVSTTGHGESIAKVILAQRILNLLAQGSPGQNAVEEAILYMEGKVGGHGGAIGITKDGELFKFYNTNNMAWASIDKDGKLDSHI